MESIEHELLGNTPFSVPPSPEQEKISVFLDLESERINRLLEQVQIVLDFLKEYRAALISAAVTGKIDIRDLSG